MLVMFDFAVTQVRYIKSGMDQILTYRPDAKVPADIDLLLTGAASVRGIYVTKSGALGEARAVRRDAIATLHDTCIDFATQAGSTFRKNRVIKDRLNRLPVQDQTFQETMTRADAMLALWLTLPDVPHAGTGDGPFTYMEGNTPVDIDLFTSRKDAAKDADEDIPEKDQHFQGAEAKLHEKQALMDDFIAAALVQGARQFDLGTPEREIIDAIPTTPPQHVPEQAEVLSAEQTGPGAAHIEVAAEFATSWDIFDLAPGATDLVLIADDVISPEFDATGLVAGLHKITAKGRNARGTGALSVPLDLTVT